MTAAPLPSAPWWSRAFHDAVQGPSSDIPLDRAAVLLAGCRSSRLRSDDDVDATLRELDHLADRVRGAGGDLFDAWHRTLFVDLGLTGNGSDYHDLRNSFLPDVLHRRVGIPITLAVIGIEVARRVQLPMWGVGMPGHFLIGHPTDGDPTPRGIRRDEVAVGAEHDTVAFVDPFHGGELLDVPGCVLRFARLFGPGRDLAPDDLDPVDPAMILLRMLNNLKQNQARRRDLEGLAHVMRLRLSLPRVSLEEHREAIRLLDATGAIDEALWAHGVARDAHGDVPVLREERRRLDARLC